MVEFKANPPVSVMFELLELNRYQDFKTSMRCIISSVKLIVEDTLDFILKLNSRDNLSLTVVKEWTA